MSRMRLSKGLLIFLLSFMALTLHLTGYIAAAQSPEGYVYYGYVPSRIYRLVKRIAIWGAELPEWTLDNETETLATEALLVFIGNHENTAVKVESIPGKNLLAEFEFDKLEMKTISLPNSTFFRTTSDKPITLMLVGSYGLVGANASTFKTNSTMLQYTINTFFTSVEGGYVGKEFIFLAVQPMVGVPYSVFALEDSDIEVYSEDGSRVSSLTLSANDVKALTFTAGRVYRLTSTGYVMVQSFGNDMTGFCAYPSAEGGFSGKVFYGSGFTPANWHGEIVETEMAVTGEKEARITIFDLENRKLSGEAEIGSDFSSSLSKTVQPYVRIDSEERMMLTYVIHGIGGGHIDSSTPGGGLTYTGVRAGERAHIPVPWEMGFVFAYQDTDMELDGTTFTLAADYYYQLTPGLHEIQPSRDVIVFLVGYPFEPINQGLASFGICIPSMQVVSLTYEDLELTPLSEEGGLSTTTYIAAAAVAVVVIALLAIWRIRK